MVIMHTGVSTIDMVKITVLTTIVFNKISQGRTRSNFPFFLYYSQPPCYLTSPYSVPYLLNRGQTKLKFAQACLANQNLRNKIFYFGGNLKQFSGSQIQLSLQQPEQTLVLENSIRIAKLYFNKCPLCSFSRTKGQDGLILALVFCISFVQLIICKELEGEDDAFCHTKTLASASAPALAIQHLDGWKATS